jgi:hypothetical protein
MPMLDEDEFARINELFAECFRSARARGATSLDAIFEPVRREYERLTGFPNCHQNAVLHHRLSLYGGPCRACGKPLRTPQAKHCAACGVSRN